MRGLWGRREKEKAPIHKDRSLTGNILSNGGSCVIFFGFGQHHRADGGGQIQRAEYQYPVSAFGQRQTGGLLAVGCLLYTSDAADEL